MGDQFSTIKIIYDMTLVSIVLLIDDQLILLL